MLQVSTLCKSMGQGAGSMECSRDKSCATAQQPFSIKYDVTRTLAILVCFSFHANTYCQKNTTYQATLNPIGIQIGNYHIDEFGAGIIELKKKNKNNFELELILNRKINSHFSAILGLSFKKLSYAFEFDIINPFDPSEITLSQERYNDRLLFGPHIGIQYTWMNFELSAGIETNWEINSRSNIQYSNSQQYIFYDTINQVVAYYSYSERDFYLNKLFLYMTPKAGLDYRLSEKLLMGCRFLLKPYGNYNLYWFQVTGEIGEIQNINDTRITNKMLYGFFGFTYML